VLKIDYKFATVCEKNDKMSGPLGGIFLTHTVCLMSQSSAWSSTQFCIFNIAPSVDCVLYSFQPFVYHPGPTAEFVSIDRAARSSHSANQSIYNITTAQHLLLR